MQFTAESYRNTSEEHLERAKKLHADGDYCFAHYLAGLAVECMLRGYLQRIRPGHDPDHNLFELAGKSRFFDIIPPEFHLEYGADFTVLNLRWRSIHRFGTNSQLFEYLSSIKADFKTKGDRYKQNSRSLLNIAIKIIQLGEAKWTQRN